MRACAGELAESAVARMRVELPHVFPDEHSVAENLVSTEASLRQLAQIIEVAGDPRRVELPPSTVAFGRSGVQRQIPLADLMRFYRLAQEAIWQWMWARITASARDAADQATAIEFATGWLFGFIDGALIRAEQIYEIEHEAWLRGTAAARAAAIDDILDEHERDPQRASKRLRYDINRHHVGVIAWVDAAPQERDAQAILGEAVAGLAGLIGAESTVVQPAGSLAVAGWLSRRGVFTPAELEKLTPGRAWGLPPGVCAAIGEPGRGLKGFRRTHIDASHARRVASLIGATGPTLTRYRSVAVAALGTADPDHAVSFVTRVLGELAADDEATRRVAMTLAVYLEENRSRNRAAERLTAHPNTVSYRVQQAEQILGRSIDTNTIDLAVALTLLPTLHGLQHLRATRL
ncbi:MAG: helix-turn-helix domain-containing protein [Mycolicibacterium sp.]|nr:helix-turn-helix domain-containing protein [Mycolicibacterium sp.]